MSLALQAVMLPCLLMLTAALAPTAWDATALAPHPHLDEGLRQEWTQRLWAHKSGTPPQRHGVLVRFHTVPGADVLKELGDAGVGFAALDGEVAHVGVFYGASVEPQHLPILLNHRLVARVSGIPQELPPLPQDNSFGKAHQWTQAWSTWWRRDPQLRRFQGTGVTLCDFDTAADIFHPLLFRADAGHYRWLDTNQNGALDVGVDAVDLNADGVAQPEEQLQQLGGGVAYTYQGSVSPTPEYFAPLHFLYADSDGSGSREYGTAYGFAENTPAYGEPLFVADDVNGNGTLDVDERLLRLGSSKLKGVYRPSEGRAYLRGVDLIETPLRTDAFHGTGVAGILVGGVFDRTAVQGVAPDADLLMVVQGSGPGELTGAAYEANRVAAFSWCEAQGARVFVHEYGTPITHFADGSSDWEAMLDTLSASGLVQATAAHNFAGNPGRARLMLQPQEVRQIAVTISNYVGSGYNLDRIMGLARWRGAAGDVDMFLTTPDGVRLDTGSQVPPTTTSHAMNGSRERSSRGTGKLSFTYAQLNANGGYLPLTQGVFNLEVRNNSSQPVDVLLYLAHNTAYAVWLSLDVPTHDDTASMAWPSTADTAIAVAAYQVNTVLSGVEGSRLTYSGRGPRIDGLKTVTVAAPADHFTALNNGPAGAGNVTVFSGTSGALPQVAGAIALLLQKEPQLLPNEVQARLVTTATGDSLTGAVPNDDWGGGRLDVHRLLFGTPAPVHAAPQLVVVPPGCTGDGAGAAWDASGSTAAVDGALLFRFDLDADGTWEHQGGPVFTPAPGAGVARAMLAEVEDADGRTNSALFPPQVLPPCPPQEADGVDGGLPFVEGCTHSAPTSWTWAALLVLLARRRSGGPP